jgi:hypothetical protein
MKMSKLYTEDQVRQMIEKSRETGLTAEYLILTTPPIELPTMEEIELKSVEYSTDTETKEFYKDCCWDFQNGAKWLFNKIKENNNE